MADDTNTEQGRTLADALTSWAEAQRPTPRGTLPPAGQAAPKPAGSLPIWWNVDHSALRRQTPPEQPEPGVTMAEQLARRQGRATPPPALPATLTRQQVEGARARLPELERALPALERAAAEAQAAASAARTAERAAPFHSDAWWDADRHAGQAQAVAERAQTQLAEHRVSLAHARAIAARLPNDPSERAAEASARVLAALAQVQGRLGAEDQQRAAEIGALWRDTTTTPGLRDVLGREALSLVLAALAGVAVPAAPAAPDASASAGDARVREKANI